MAFAPAQDHQVELPVTLVHQVPCVSVRELNVLSEATEQSENMSFQKLCIISSIDFDSIYTFMNLNLE